MDDFRLIAILGGSGSGKSALGLQLAQKLNCEIFSLDSLAVYKYFDIVSAKPSQAELQHIFHYGINILKPDQDNKAPFFRQLLLQAIQESKNKGKNTLLIIGGSSFYLKSILEGLSPLPPHTKSKEIAQKIAKLDNPYSFLSQIDPSYALNCKDSYRIHRGLEIYFATLTPPSLFFATHPKEAFPYPIEKYAIAIDRELLRARIAKRTELMLKNGLLEEIKEIYTNYDYTIQPSSAIGVKESLEFLTQTPLQALQGKTPREKSSYIAQTPQELCNLISTHTAQLAKRQSTFNRTQFGEVHSLCQSKKEIRQSAREGIVWGRAEELLEFIEYS